MNVSVIVLRTCVAVSLCLSVAMLLCCYVTIPLLFCVAMLPCCYVATQSCQGIKVSELQRGLGVAEMAFW